MADNAGMVDMRRIAKQCTLTVKLRGGRRFWLGMKLVKLGCWVAGGIVVRMESAN